MSRSVASLAAVAALALAVPGLAGAQNLPGKVTLEARRAAVPINRILSAEVRTAIFDGVRPGSADRHKLWLTLEARY